MTERPRIDDKVAVRAGSARLGDRTAFQYAVTFLCGSASETEDNGVQQVTRGVYFTLINVHNPSSLAVTFSWRAIVETKLGIALNPPQISGSRSITMNSSSVAKIDALDLFSVTTGSGDVIIGGSALLAGYAVILSPIELDVTVLYTSRPQQGYVTSIDVKTVHPRTVTVARSADSGIKRLQSRIARVTQHNLAQAFARLASLLEARSVRADFRGGFGGGSGGGGGGGRDFGGPGSPVPEPIPPEPTEPSPSPVPEPIPPEPTEPA